MSSESFTTGAKRGSQVGKGRPDLISPWANQALASVLEAGAAEYGDRNWEKGIPIMRHMASCKRHIDQFIMRLTEETKDGKVVPVNHLWNAYANLMMAIHTMEMIQAGVLPGELDDRPDYGQKFVGPVIGATQPVVKKEGYYESSDGYIYFCVRDCPNGEPFDFRRRHVASGEDYYWWRPTSEWLVGEADEEDWGVFNDAESVYDVFDNMDPGTWILNNVTLEEWQTYVDSH